MKYVRELLFETAVVVFLHGHEMGANVPFPIVHKMPLLHRRHLEMILACIHWLCHRHHNITCSFHSCERTLLTLFFSRALLHFGSASADKYTVHGSGRPILAVEQFENILHAFLRLLPILTFFEEMIRSFVRKFTVTFNTLLSMALHDSAFCLWS